MIVSDLDAVSVATFPNETNAPPIIFALLFGLALVSSLLAGGAMAGSKSRGWLHMVCLPVVMAVAVYVILDIECPRSGLIRMDAFDRALVELRQGMK